MIAYIVVKVAESDEGGARIVATLEQFGPSVYWEFEDDRILFSAPVDIGKLVDDYRAREAEDKAAAKAHAAEMGRLTRAAQAEAELHAERMGSAVRGPAALAALGAAKGVA